MWTEEDTGFSCCVLIFELSSSRHTDHCILITDLCLESLSVNRTVACGLTTCLSLPDTTLMADLVSGPSPRVRSLHHTCFSVRPFTQNQVITSYLF